MRHDSFTWDMTRSYEASLVRIRHDSFIWDVAHSYETWLMHETGVLKIPQCRILWHVRASFACLIDMPHWHASLTWLIDMSHDSFTWDNHIDVTHERDTRSERERRQDARRRVWWNFSRVSSEVILHSKFGLLRISWKQHERGTHLDVGRTLFCKIVHEWLHFFFQFARCLPR